MNILFISSRDIDWSAGLARDFVNSLKMAMHNVEFLTTYAFDGMDETMYSVYQERRKYEYFSTEKVVKRSFLKRVFSLTPTKIYHKIFFPNTEGRYIVLDDEKKPVVPISDLLNAIPQRKYDYVITLFWDGMLSSYSLKAIYEKLKCPIHIFSVDMFPVTGGCSNIGSCKNFEKECRNCVLETLGDAHKNFLVKKSVYDSIDCTIYGNTWMSEFFAKSGLFSNAKKAYLTCPIDEKKFKLLDKNKARKRFGLSEDAFVLFCGAADFKRPRKGFSYLIKSFEYLVKTNRLPKKCILMIAGKENPEFNSLIPLEYKNVGFLSVDDLVLAYNAANVYLSPSIIDAGPSMINQSLMCGTPVVAYHTGVAIDFVKTAETGYKAKYKDYKDFAEGIRIISTINQELLRNNCRKLAMDNFSLEYYSNRFKKDFS
ncbi:MAG: glycosyltransferase [Paludibacteraceae bacterium]|nr:glycosyltransferase [Paludibacteraceae bacterium]